jgi:hypothetical protein
VAHKLALRFFSKWTNDTGIEGLHLDSDNNGRASRLNQKLVSWASDHSVSARSRISLHLAILWHYLTITRRTSRTLSAPGGDCICDRKRITVCVVVALCSLGFPYATFAGPQSLLENNPFAQLSIYNGEWRVYATHPWSGAPAGTADQLRSRCRRLTLYFVCEQTVNAEVKTLIVYTVGTGQTQFNTRTIVPNGLAGGRGDLTIDDTHWTYLDKPPTGLKGPWSRVENIIIDKNHIQFREYESQDEGVTWIQTNSGMEKRVSDHLLIDR